MVYVEIRILTLIIIVTSSTALAYDSLGNSYLNSEEMKLALENPYVAYKVHDCAQKALEEEKTRFGYNGRNNGGDAFRHAFWNALMVKELGTSQAKIWATAHEYKSDDPTGTKMDLYNNQIGREIGEKNRYKSNSLISDDVHNAINSGRLITAPTLESPLATPTSTVTPTATPTGSLAKTVEDLGGVNFTSINLNYISVADDDSSGINFDYILRGHKSEGSVPVIDTVNSTLMTITAFKVGLALPNNVFWVNLNPVEPDRIIDEQLARTDIGRVMLEADLQMKMDFSNYANPCANETGKTFCSTLREKQTELVQRCMDKFPGQISDANSIAFKAVTRFWIVPDKIYAYTNGTSIYLINSTLTIYSDPTSEQTTFQMINQDSVILSNECKAELSRSAVEYGKYARELQDMMILPYVVYDVNYDKKYEDLRNVFISLALAQWYKSHIPPDEDVFGYDLNSSANGTLESPSSWSSRKIWDKYMYSVQNGEFRCWQNRTLTTNEGIMIESLLVSLGGVEFGRIEDDMITIEGIPPEIEKPVKEAAVQGFINEKKDALFGTRVHADLINRYSGSVSSSSGFSPGSPEAEKESETYHQGHSGGGNSTLNEINNNPCGPCPDGWTGPNEKCECWKTVSECPPGWTGPDEEGKCRSSELKCPPGYDGPNENGECWRWEVANSN